MADRDEARAGEGETMAAEQTGAASDSVLTTEGEMAEHGQCPTDGCLAQAAVVEEAATSALYSWLEAAATDSCSDAGDDEASQRCEVA